MKTERVKAHVFVCMLAYRVIWKGGRVFRAFQKKPDTDTFKDLENIPDGLAEKTLDAVVGAAPADSSLKSHAVPAGGNESGAAADGSSRAYSRSTAPGSPSILTIIFRYLSRRKAGRRRKVSVAAVEQDVPPLQICRVVIVHASPFLAEPVILECLKEPYAEASESLLREGIDMSVLLHGLR